MNEELVKLIKQKIWCIFPFVSLSVNNNYSRYDIKIVMQFYYKDSDCYYTEYVSKEIFDCCSDDVEMTICNKIAKDCITYIIDTMEDKV